MGRQHKRLYDGLKKQKKNMKSSAVSQLVETNSSVYDISCFNCKSAHQNLSHGHYFFESATTETSDQ